MDILLYLAELLQTHKEVGLPELGTFFKKKSPGRYDAELHSFLPPSYVLLFKQEVTEEALLSEYISKEHRISLDASHHYRDQFISKLKQELEQNGETDLSSLGKLYKSAEGIRFEADPKANLGFDFYGLPQVKEVEKLTTSEPLTALEEVIVENTAEEENPGNLPEEVIYHEDREIAKAEEERHVETTTSTPVVPVQEEPEEQVHEEIAEAPVAPEQIIPAPAPEVQLPPVQTPPFYKEPDVLPEEPRRGTPVYLKVILGVLIALIALMVAFLLQPQWFDALTGNKMTPEQKSVPQSNIKTDVKDSLSTKADALTPSDSVKKDTLKTTTKTAPVKEIPAKVTTAVPVTPPAVQAEGTTYEVIGSSVYGEKAAQDFIAYMKRQWGIDAKIVDQRPGKKIKISIASFKEETTARAERKRLEEKIKISGLYIYTDTHKSK
ncbi:hypothetical protein [Pedobacter sp.]|uniref:HU domain-containing protein n=1 Tax=Pedobacter sp. TaxID=1411316 RepID=UPI002CDA8A81|nr:hypothetical protein [Pedobacter sp.]HWW42426.1 hypothetical protein [Pedobacter sp.]